MAAVLSILLGLGSLASQGSVAATSLPKKLAEAELTQGLENGVVRVKFGRALSEVLVDAWVGEKWQRVITGIQTPIAGGEGQVVREETTAGKKTLEMRGPGWSLRTEANLGGPAIRFVLTVNLEKPVPITGETTLLGVLVPNAKVTSDQGPMSIYGGNIYGAGFPVSYAWQPGVETAVFFDLTHATWFGPATPRRHLDARVVARPLESGSELGFRSFAGHSTQIGPGQIKLIWHVATRASQTQPSRIEALARSVDLVSPLHPAQKAPKSLGSWKEYAKDLIATLRRSDARAVIDRPWNDGALGLVPPIQKVVTHPSHVGQLGSDFSTTNNHLSPSLLYLRVNPNNADLELARQKVNQLPIYFNDKGKFIGWNPYGTGSLAMSWQTLWFAIETLRASEVSEPGEFNPSVAGRFLMGAQGLEELAKKNAYAFPQWWYPESKLPAIQNDVPELGVVYEPWQVGQYAYILTKAHEIDKDANKLAEAKRSLGALFETVRFQVKSARYERSYSEPADFPIAELFGNAYGAVASYKIHAITKDHKFKEYGRRFLATLLRLTPWYEDQIGPVASDLSSLGLFYPHGGAYNPTPWETTEANLCIAWVLANVPDAPYRKLLVQLSNLNRVNSFGFFPANWSPTVQKHAGLEAMKTLFLPIEPFYTFEAPGGHTGAPILYSSTSLWNYWLYEALAKCSNPAIMVLNLAPLGGYEAALSGVERRFLLHNSSRKMEECRLQMNGLPKGSYLVERLAVGGWSTLGRFDSSELEKGTAVGVGLGPNAVTEIRVRNLDPKVSSRVAAQTATQKVLASAYARLHLMPVERSLPLAAGFKKAMDLYRSNRLSEAKKTAELLR